MSDDFSISVHHGEGRATVACRGALDLLPAEKLREAMTLELERGSSRILLDCSHVTLLTSAGITALVDVALSCKEADAELDMELSGNVRRILDLVGLWWLGVVDDGISVHASLQSALRNYADHSFQGVLDDGADPGALEKES